MSEELYGIDIEKAHKRAIELIPEEFFWSCGDELAPFGSDEGDTALAEFREWRKDNPHTPVLECLKWTIEGVGEMEFTEYNERLLSKDLIRSQINDGDFDDRQYIFTLDISVIATGFGQLVDEGFIETECKPVINLAIDRQIAWAELQNDWDYSSQYISYLNVLKKALEQA